MNKVEMLKSAAKDKRLSAESMGVLMMLCFDDTAMELASAPSELAKHVGVGRNKIYEILKSLQDCGYIYRGLTRNDKARVTGSYTKLATC